MKQAIRALGWAVGILWIMLLLFTVTAVYSAVQIRPSLGEPSATASGSTLMASLPIVLYNGGFYDLSQFNITTQVRDQGSAIITRSSTLVPLVSAGANVTITHSMSLSIEQVATGHLSRLLFNDSELEIEAVVRLLYARVFPFEISLNSSMPWGAPFANLTLGSISVTPLNLTHIRARVPLSFENHSFLALGGTLHLEIVDDANHLVGGGSTVLNAPSNSRFEADVEVLTAGNPADFREARLYFQTPFFNYGPLVMPIV